MKAKAIDPKQTVAVSLPADTNGRYMEMMQHEHSKIDLKNLKKDEDEITVFHINEAFSISLNRRDSIAEQTQTMFYQDMWKTVNHNNAQKVLIPRVSIRSSPRKPRRPRPNTAPKNPMKATTKESVHMHKEDGASATPETSAQISPISSAYSIHWTSPCY